MAKTEKELRELKAKTGDFSKELRELTDEELDQVAGGIQHQKCDNGCLFNPLKIGCVCP